jgi:mono/diheme cytochrome c family protein
MFRLLVPLTVAAIWAWPPTVSAVQAAPPPAPAGEAEEGKRIFNGIGGCYTCHGYDGDLARRPQFSAKLAEELGRLDPQPSDLRNPAGLKSEDDAQRLQTIKFGHPGTAMFPKKFLTDGEMANLLAYLATLRTGGTATERDRAR